ncbi:hypothetical protein [Methanobacterium sp. SMA-27]|uniref:hypothetical protein n=1 Tax=Methanobacterium sp. SMA-27 TaxID=1495336 RepID=UPI00064FB83F|nr:hypothetical protein [Methanobacterium sp. SMA-27]
MKIINNKIFILVFLVGIILALSMGNNNILQAGYSTVPTGTNGIPTDLTVNNIHGSTHHYAFIKAYLTDNHGKPLSNKIIAFNIDDDSNIYITVTSTSGYALLYYYIYQSSGTYPINAKFQEDQTYSGSTSTSMLTIE